MAKFITVLITQYPNKPLAEKVKIIIDKFTGLSEYQAEQIIKTSMQKFLKNSKKNLAEEQFYKTTKTTISTSTGNSIQSVNNNSTILEVESPEALPDSANISSHLPTIPLGKIEPQGEIQEVLTSSSAVPISSENMQHPVVQTQIAMEHYPIPTIEQVRSINNTKFKSASEHANLPLQNSLLLNPYRPFRCAEEIFLAMKKHGKL